MKKAGIEIVAMQIYHLIIGENGWEGSPPSVKAFYRKIARWHLSRMDDDEKKQRNDSKR